MSVEYREPKQRKIKRIEMRLGDDGIQFWIVADDDTEIRATEFQMIAWSLTQLNNSKLLMVGEQRPNLGVDPRMINMIKRGG